MNVIIFTHLTLEEKNKVEVCIILLNILISWLGGNETLISIVYMYICVCVWEEKWLIYIYGSDFL